MANARWRIRIISALVMLFAAALVSKLYFVQVVRGEKYAEMAEERYRRPQDIFDRGSIFFEDKKGLLVSAATLKSGYALVVNPKEIEDPLEAYEKLSAVVPEIDKDKFLLKAGGGSGSHADILKKLPKEKADEIEALGVKGAGVRLEKWRYYPAGDMAAHTLGFVGWKGDSLEGVYGIEKYYEDILSRDSGENYANFFAEIFIGVKKSVSEGSARKGDIVTTIEPAVQSYLEKEADKIKEKWNPDLVGGIIMDPKTGEVRAMAALPDFSLNDYGDVESNLIYGNPMVESVYEMGSIMKPLTVAAGLDAGVIKASDTYYDSGSVTLNKATISNFDGKGRGTVSMQEVLSQSLNTGVVHIMQKLGRERFAEYMTNYDLGEETGIDLPGEVAGLTENLSSKRDIEHATAAFGQGIATTPIATIRALSALANGGELVTPHVVKRINYDLGYSREIIPARENERILRPETSGEITRMLVEVVDKALLGGTVKMDRYSLAAKTGTAEIANPAGGGYYKDKNLHSFFGYFPAYDPRFIVFFYAVNPKGVKYASETLTRPFMDTAKFLINYYEIPPDR